jgi:hypothetical protein
MAFIPDTYDRRVTVGLHFVAVKEAARRESSPVDLADADQMGASAVENGMTRRRIAVLLALLFAGMAGTAIVQTQVTQTLPAITSACKNALPPPAAEPPAGSSPVVLFVELCFVTAPGPRLPGETYVRHLRLLPLVSLPSRGRWTPFTTAVEQTVADDVERLREQSYVAGAAAEFNDYIFPNGTVGKVISYHLNERTDPR